MSPQTTQSNSGDWHFAWSPLILVISDPLLIDWEDVSFELIVVKFNVLFIERLSGCPWFVTFDKIGLNKAGCMKRDEGPDWILENALIEQDALIGLTKSFRSKLFNKSESNCGVTLLDVITELDLDSISAPSEQEGEQSIISCRRKREKK